MTSSNPPLRIPLFTQPNNRAFDISVDAKLVDCYVEKDAEGKLWVTKRPGFAPRGGSFGSGAGLGIYRWQQQIYSIVGTQFYEGTVAKGTVDSTASYWFRETLGTPSYLYFSNGVKAYTFSSAGVFAQITDAAYPPLTVPGVAILDGTTYVLDKQANIWGSLGLNNPNTWSALNVIVAQIEPDHGVAIAKQLIYVVVLKESSTEFFYDAANPTGSPLLPVQNAKIGYGCADGRTVQSIDDMLFFIASTHEGGLMVGKIKGLKFEQISSPALNRFLTSNFSAGAFFSASLRIHSHTYYMLSSSNIIPANTWLVYDVYEGVWYYWTNPLNLRYSSGVDIATGGLTNVLQDSIGVQYIYNDASLSTQDQLLNGTLLPIVTDIITPNFDGGVKVKKVLSKLKLLGDQLSGGTLMIRWTDDDYKTWTSWRTVNLQQEYPTLTNLGTFRRRAFHFRHQINTPFRMGEVESDLLLGSA